jgi:cardiolipin synthase (CMP-forming)
MRHLPNLICLVRILLIWPTIDALVSGHYWTALVLVAVCAVSDGLDGWLAKRFNWQSHLGRILDPLADKLLLVAIFLTATWMNLLPWWLTAVAVACDVLIGSGGVV